MKQLLSLLILSALILSACRKKDEKDTTKPTIVFDVAPDTLYNNGETVHMEITVEDNDELHRVMIEVKDVTSDTLYLSKTEHPDARHKYYHEMVTTSIKTTTADFEVTVEAEDHAGNMETVKKTFRVQ